MLHQDKLIIAQHRIPQDTNEITQVKELLGRVNLENAVVTGNAAHAQRSTADYIAGGKAGGTRGSDYFMFVKGIRPRALARHPERRPARPRSDGTVLRVRPQHPAVHLGHRPLGDLAFPHATQVIRIAGPATTSPARRSPRRSCTPSPAWTQNTPARRTWPGSPAASGGI